MSRALLALAVALPSAAAAEQLPVDFLLIAHRGVTGEDWPENSLASLEETIRRGYTHIEVDVRATREGVPVCHHDARLRLRGGGHEDVGAVTLAELRENAAPEDVPDFSTFCARAAGRIRLMVDVKDCPESVREVFLGHVRDALNRHELREGALFIGRGWAGAALAGGGARRSCGHSPAVLARGDVRLNPGSFFAFGHAGDFHTESLAAFRDAGVPVIVSINQFHYLAAGNPLERGTADVTRMLELGADGLQIDSEYEPAVRTFFRAGHTPER